MWCRLLHVVHSHLAVAREYSHVVCVYMYVDVPVLPCVKLYNYDSFPDMWTYRYSTFNLTCIHTESSLCKYSLWS